MNVVTEKNRIYLSGKITGLTPQECGRNFRMAGWKLQRDHGNDNVEIINPLMIKPFLGIKTWFFHMISDLWQLRKCHTIYMLSNWQESRGAKIEKKFAEFLNKKVMYQ